MGVSGHDIEEIGDVRADVRVGGDQPHVGVHLGGGGVVVSGADVHVAGNPLRFAPDHEAELGVYLHADEPVDYVDARLLHLFGPRDVAFLIETGFQLDHGGDLLAGAPGFDKGFHDGRSVAHAVERLFDGDDAGVLAGAADEIQNRGETVVGMEEENIPALDVRVDVAFLKHARRTPVKGGFFQARPVHAVKGHEFGKGQRPLDPINLERLHPQPLGQERAELLGRAVGYLKAHHVAEAALFHQILDGFQQIVGFVLLDLHVGIARDAEQPGVDDSVAGEQRAEVFGDQIFQQDDVAVTDVGVEAERGIGFGLLVPGDEDEAGDVVGALQAGEPGDAVTAAQLDDEVEAGIGNRGEGVARIDGLRGQDGVDFVPEVAVEELALLFREVRIAHQAYALVVQLRGQPLAPMLLGAGNQNKHLAPDFGELFGGRHAVRRRGHGPAAVLAIDVRHPDHKEFIEVVVEDGEEFKLLKERETGIRGFVEHFRIEVQPIDFPVQVQVGAGQFTDFLCGAQLLRVPFGIFGNHDRSSFA